MKTLESIMNFEVNGLCQINPHGTLSGKSKRGTIVAIDGKIISMRFFGEEKIWRFHYSDLKTI